MPHKGSESVYYKKPRDEYEAMSVAVAENGPDSLPVPKGPTADAEASSPKPIKGN